MIQDYTKLFAEESKEENKLKTELKNSLKEYGDSTIKTANLLSNLNRVLLSKLSSEEKIDEDILNYYLIKNYILYRYSNRYNESSDSERFMGQYFHKNIRDINIFNELLDNGDLTSYDILEIAKTYPSIHFYISLVYINTINDDFNKTVDSIDNLNNEKITDLLLPLKNLLFKESPKTLKRQITI